MGQIDFLKVQKGPSNQILLFTLKNKNNWLKNLKS